MNKEKLTVETDEHGTITYRNADGDFHNPHGPAIVCANGDKFYYIKDQLHNPNGPAVVYADGKKWYYINDKELTETKFKVWQVEQSAPLHNKIAVIGGVEYTLTAK